MTPKEDTISRLNAWFIETIRIALEGMVSLEDVEEALRKEIGRTLTIWGLTVSVDTFVKRVLSSLANQSTKEEPHE